MTKVPLDAAALEQLFTKARSFDHFINRPVDQKILEAIWDLFKYGPTSANMLPARIVWCISEEAKSRLADCAIDGNKRKILNAPASFIVAMDLDFHENLPELYPHTDAKSWFDGPQEERFDHALRNSSLQGAYLILAARALGLDVGPMSGFDQNMADKLFLADTPHQRSNFIGVLGYGDEQRLHPRGPRPDFQHFNKVI